MRTPTLDSGVSSFDPEGKPFDERRCVTMSMYVALGNVPAREPSSEKGMFLLICPKR
jgi:hypothetical protein